MSLIEDAWLYVASFIAFLVVSSFVKNLMDALSNGVVEALPK